MAGYQLYMTKVAFNKVQAIPEAAVNTIAEHIVQFLETETVWVKCEPDNTVRFIYVHPVGNPHNIAQSLTNYLWSGMFDDIITRTSCFTGALTPTLESEQAVMNYAKRNGHTLDDGTYTLFSTKPKNIIVDALDIIFGLK